MSQSRNDIADELKSRRERDQQVRQRCETAEELAAMHEVDEENCVWLRAILAVHGWPRLSEWGEEATFNFWLLAQHCPDPDFQSHCLDLLLATPTHERIEANVAYLSDRVNLHRNDWQEFGTQIAFAEDGKPYARNLREASSVDDRRAAVGLEPLATYLRLFTDTSN